MMSVLNTIDKEAGPVVDKLGKGVLKVGQGAKSAGKYMYRKSGMKQLVADTGNAVKDMNKTRNLRALKTDAVEKKRLFKQSKKAYKSALPGQTSQAKDDAVRLEGAQKGMRKEMKRTKREFKKMRKAKTNLVNKGSLAVGTGAGVVGTKMYLEDNQKDKVAGIDKEASILGKLLMKSRMGVNRVAKLKKVRATRNARDVSGSALKGKHQAELNSGSYKGMEGALAKRQAGEAAASKAKYQKGINSLGLKNTKPLGASASTGGGVDMGRMSAANNKANWGKPTKSGGVNLGKMTPKATAKVNRNFNKPVPKTVVPPKQVGAVNMGKMKPIKPNTPAKPVVANNATLKMPALNMKNLKRGGVGAVGLTAGSQVYDGLGGGSNRRVINNY